MGALAAPAWAANGTTYDLTVDTMPSTAEVNTGQTMNASVITDDTDPVTIELKVNGIVSDTNTGVGTVAIGPDGFSYSSPINLPVVVTVYDDQGTVRASSTQNILFYDVPDAPDAPSITPGNGSLDISWTAPASNNESIDLYEYEVYDTLGAAVVDSGTTSSLTHFSSGLNNGVNYDVRVRAQNAAGWGSWSSVTTSSPTTVVPDAPDAVSVDAIGYTTASVSWGAPALDGGEDIDYYELRYGASDADTATWTTYTTADGVTLSHDITGLVDAVQYSFQVRAHNAVGFGPWSLVTNDTTADQTWSATLEAPESLSVNIGDTVNLNGMVETNDATDAISGALKLDGVDLVTAEGTGSATLSTSWVPTEAGDFDVTVVAYDSHGTLMSTSTLYTITVASSEEGSSEPTPTPSDSAPAVVAPSVVTNLTGSASGSTVTLSWGAPEWNGGDANMSYTVSGDGGSTTTANTLVISNVSAGSHTYAVTASNSAGSGPAASVTVTVEAAGTEDGNDDTTDGTDDSTDGTDEGNDNGTMFASSKASSDRKGNARIQLRGVPSMCLVHYSISGPAGFSKSGSVQAGEGGRAGVKFKAKKSGAYTVTMDTDASCSTQLHSVSIVTVKAKKRH